MLEFFLKGLRNLLIGLMLMAAVVLFIIRQFSSIGIDINSIISGIDIFKMIMNFSGNINF